MNEKEQQKENKQNPFINYKSEGNKEVKNLFKTPKGNNTSEKNSIKIVKKALEQGRSSGPSSIK